MSVFWAAYCCYIGLYFSGSADILSSVKLLATIQAINGLKSRMFEMAVGIPAYYTLFAVLERFSSILNMEPVQMKCIKSKVWAEEMQTENIAVLFNNFQGFWKDDPKTPALKDISLKIKKKEMIGIMGKVGSGKSSLLNAVLEELPYFAGSYQIKGKVAFVEQEAILFSDTIK